MPAEMPLHTFANRYRTSKKLRDSLPFVIESTGHHVYIDKVHMMPSELTKLEAECVVMQLVDAIGDIEELRGCVTPSPSEMSVHAFAKAYRRSKKLRSTLPFVVESTGHHVYVDKVHMMPSELTARQAEYFVMQLVDAICNLLKFNGLPAPC